MERHEMAEKLVEKCGISYEEAGDVLREAGYDLLEAMIILERRGKLGNKHQNNWYSTGIMQNYTATAGNKSAADAESLSEFFKIAWTKFCELMRNFMRYNIILSKDGREIISFPVLLALILVCFTAGLVFSAVIVSLVFGFSYSIKKI